MKSLRKQAGIANFALVLICRETLTDGQDVLDPAGLPLFVSESLVEVMDLENPDEEAAFVDLSALVNGG